MNAKLRTNIHFRYFIALLVILFSGTLAKANETAEDSVRFSLITCAPGEEIYSLYGHTAIRYENPAEGVDVVFNYGIFSFDTPNFVWRFVKGETDYNLEVSDYRNFIYGYMYEDRQVWQQTLNLTAEEKQKLLQILAVNCQPENKTYRYNFFFDNCATRPRDRIEDSIDGKVVYQDSDYRQTFRDIVHESTKGYAWDRFGMDFCLGIDADKLITHRQEMFAPLYLMNAFSTAIITDADGSTRPLVSDTAILYPAKEEKAGKSYLFTPMRTFLLLFIVITAATIYGIKKRKSLWGVDLVLFAAAGVAGCILTLLNFFSEHPAVSPNLLIIVFHPLHLLLLPFFLRKEMKGQRSWYHLINSAVLTIFILLIPAIPQYINPSVIPMALSLLVRSVSNLVLTYKKK